MGRAAQPLNNAERARLAEPKVLVDNLEPGPERGPTGRSEDGGRHRISKLSSLTLFLRARAGDSAAVSTLFRRLLPQLRQWARGKLPYWARRRADTDDLVQEAFANLHKHLKRIEPRRRDALAAYLRQSIRNRIRDEVRRGERVEVGGLPLTDALDSRLRPDQEAQEHEDRERYCSGLKRLDIGDQELIVGRLELGLGYEQLALATGRASPDAARVAVRRALLRLAEEIANA